ncbi:AAA family ATPase [Salinibacterium sp.]|uniref:AAA family ATPase n=1 Tax=Salinibacterium sp. TaxID=1915057 RepID=UPI00286C6FBB|nr:AAA family ATPase [Salinibacterium sp.]
MNESDRASGIHRPAASIQQDAIFLNGTVGVGKSTLAAALSASETSVHAVIDLDDIRRLSPAPEGDRFNHELALANLRSVVVNYRRAGAVRFIVAGVIEKRAEVARYREALGVERMFICRLVASKEVVAERLVRRHRADSSGRADLSGRADASGLAWHLARADELGEILRINAVEHLLLDSTFMSPRDVAVTVRDAAGWS